MNKHTAQAQNGNYEPVFIVKCTRKCNLRCEYCKDYRTTEDQHFSIESLIELFNGIAEESSIARAHFIWHGGEPLTMGQDYFKKIVFLQEKFLQSKGPVTNSIQTNGTLITKKWAEILHYFNFSSGLSLDGPKQVQDSCRPFAMSKQIQLKASNGNAEVINQSTKSSYDAAIDGLKILFDNNVSTGVLTVVSEAVLNIGPEKMYRFYRELDINNIALLWMRGKFNKTEQSLWYNKKYGEFMSEILRLWLDEDNPDVRIREVDSKLNRILGLPQSLCKDGGPCVGKFFGVETDGSVWHCDKFLGDNRFYVGNLRMHSVGEVLNPDRLHDIAQIELHIRKVCQPCKWFEQCQGGCLSDLMIMLRDGGTVGTHDCWNFTLYEALSKTLSKSPAIQKFVKERSQSVAFS